MALKWGFEGQVTGAKWEKLLGRRDGAQEGPMWDDSGNSGANDMEAGNPRGNVLIHLPTGATAF